MQTGDIPDSSITASSYLPDRGPSSARYVLVYQAVLGALSDRPDLYAPSGRLEMQKQAEL